MEKDDEEKEAYSDFGYMEELSRAYREALAKRIVRASELPDEKKEAIAAMQREIKEIGERVLHGEVREERRELSLMIKESAEEMLNVLGKSEGTPAETVPAERALARAVMLANRSLNLLVRHAKEQSQLLNLIFSELSALYALAAIN